MKIEQGRISDIEAWMNLVNRVRDLFPGMETEEAMTEHRETVLDFMQNHTAICAKEQERILGVLLFSREYNMICFMATDPDYRRQGIAGAMYERMLSEADPLKRIVVTTYRDKDPKGIAARAFYQSKGFIKGSLIEEFGYPSQILILPRETI